MYIDKVWSMPNSRTFKIEAIKDLILKYTNFLSAEKPVILDPFANESSIKQYLGKYRYINNDIDTQYNTMFHLHAPEFLQKFKDESIDMVLIDMPYSPRQVSECYKKLGKTVTMRDTSNAFFSDVKKEVARIVKPKGYVISCCWNSNGVGKKLGFEQIEILLIAHGSNHNDTIVTVEQKVLHM